MKTSATSNVDDCFLGVRVFSFEQVIPVVSSVVGRQPSLLLGSQVFEDRFVAPGRFVTLTRLFGFGAFVVVGRCVCSSFTLVASGFVR